MEKILNVPDARISVIIGKKGETKRYIENATNTVLDIEECVHIKGEPLNVMTCENIVKGIARGFSPQNALDLAEENKILLVIKISEDKKELKRIRSRLIGSGGKAKKKLELTTNSKLSIYGKTVSIITHYKNMDIIENAIEKLIKGESHRKVYRFIETQLKEKVLK